jgi:hypothetical protein
MNGLRPDGRSDEQQGQEQGDEARQSPAAHAAGPSASCPSGALTIDSVITHAPSPRPRHSATDAVAGKSNSDSSRENAAA